MDTTHTGMRKFLDKERALACVHCGLCLTACPTYLETGNENDSPRGRIHLMRAVEDDRMPLGAQVVEHLDRCLGCRACETACPSGVQYGRLIEATREFVEAHHRRSLRQRWLRRVVIERLFPYPHRFRWALWLVTLLRALSRAKLVPRWASEAASLVPVDYQPDRMPTFVAAETTLKRGRVGFFRGCVTSVLFGRANAATVRLLNRLGYDVVIPAGQGCCGALDAHRGRLGRARVWARQNLHAFRTNGVEAVISNAAGCGSTLKEYGDLLAHDPEWAGAGQEFAARVKDLTEFLAQPDLLAELKERVQTGCAVGGCAGAGRVTVHDACHLAHAQEITQPPRELVKAVAGDRYVELPEADVCCGSAGSYNLTQPELAGRLGKRKVQHIRETEAVTVVTTNPGCILQIQAGLAKSGAGEVRVRHIAEFLMDAWDADAERADTKAQ